MYSVLERFCQTIRDRRQRDQLLKAIRGRRAFRDFRTVVQQLGLNQQWTGFRNRAFETVAIDWLDKNGIGYNRAA